MSKVKSGDFVSVMYTGSLDDGQIFDSNEGQMPFDFQVDANQVIQGFNDAVKGMDEGEEKKFRLEATEAYGPHNPDLVREFPVSALGPDANPEVGQTIAVQAGDGRQYPARITKVEGGQMTIDLNSPLAGNALTFNIRVVGISDRPKMNTGGCSCSSGSCGTGGSSGCGTSGCDCG